MRTAQRHKRKTRGSTEVLDRVSMPCFASASHVTITDQGPVCLEQRKSKQKGHHNSSTGLPGCALQKRKCISQIILQFSIFPWLPVPLSDWLAMLAGFPRTSKMSEWGTTGPLPLGFCRSPRKTFPLPTIWRGTACGVKYPSRTSPQRSY